MMNTEKWILLSNFLAKGAVALLALVTAPIYLKILGPEIYGLVGFFTLIANVFGLFDMGLSNALMREFSRLSALCAEPILFRNLTRTLETIFWVISIFLGGFIILGSELISIHWLQSPNLPSEMVQKAIASMGICLSFLWPCAVYQSGLVGLQKQVANNFVIISFAFVKNLGSVCVLYFVSPTVVAFFIWQMIVNLLQTSATGVILWRSLPKAVEKSRFEWLQLKSIGKYASSMALLSLVTVLFVNLDRFLLSMYLDLKTFGYYILATNLSTALFLIISPIFATYFPELTRLVALQDQDKIKKLYHKSSQIMSVILLPAAFLIFYFSDTVLWVLTRNAEAITACTNIVQFLVLGTACNGLMNIPFALQLAHGWVKYAIWQNVISCIVLIPLTIWAAQSYGVNGVAPMWLIHNGACILIMIPIIHRKFLDHELKQWFLQDIGMPLFVSAAIAFLMRFIWPVPSSYFSAFNSLVAMYFIGVFATALSSSWIREIVKEQWSRKKLTFLAFLLKNSPP